MTPLESVAKAQREMQIAATGKFITGRFGWGSALLTVLVGIAGFLWFANLP